MANYLTVAELRAYTKDSSSLDQTIYEDVIEAASREIDATCGRYFSLDSSTSIRYFWPQTQGECKIDDLATATALTVAVDSGGDGTYAQTWTVSTDFFLEPVNQRQAGITGWPYTRLTGTFATKSFPIRHLYQNARPTVKVTGTWGWAATPAAVKQATKIVAAKLYKMADAPFGVAGFDAFGAVRVREIPEVMTLLSPFILDKYATA